MSYAKVCVLRDGKWINTWNNNRVVSEKTARRYNNHYIVLRKRGIPRKQITLNMLYGNPYRVASPSGRFLSVDDYSVKARRLDRRDVKLIKVATAEGKKLYDPFTKKFHRKSTRKRLRAYTYRLLPRCIVHLYVPTKDLDYIYHYYRFRPDVYMKPVALKDWRRDIEPQIDRIFDEIYKNSNKYPLGTGSGVYIRFVGNYVSDTASTNEFGMYIPMEGGVYRPTADGIRILKSKVMRVLKTYVNRKTASARGMILHVKELSFYHRGFFSRAELPAGVEARRGIKFRHQR